MTSAYAKPALVIKNPHNFIVDIDDLRQAIINHQGEFRCKTITRLPLRPPKGQYAVITCRNITYVHRLLYQYYHPEADLKGNNVIFKDGNIMNLRRDNLVLMSHSAHSAMLGSRRKGCMTVYKDLTKEKILEVLRKHYNSFAGAAAELGISTLTLQRRVRALRIRMRPVIRNNVGCIVNDRDLLRAIKRKSSGKLNVCYTIQLRGHSTKYPDIAIDGKHYLIHRLLVEYWLKRKLRSDEVVHHEDENVLNATRRNLKPLTHTQHAQKHILSRRRRLKNKRP